MHPPFGFASRTFPQPYTETANTWTSHRVWNLDRAQAMHTPHSSSAKGSLENVLSAEPCLSFSQFFHNICSHPESLELSLDRLWVFCYP